MSALRQLAESLGLSSDPIPAPATPPVQQAANDATAPKEISQERHEAPAAEATSEPTRNAWTVTRNGKPICTMVAEPTTYAEALALARWRWPDAALDSTPMEPNP